MTDEATPRLAMPLLLPEQAQKEMFHNEALAALDLLVQATVEAVGVDSPPAAAGGGQCWVIGAAPDGAWTGQAGAVAGFTGGGWRFAPPFEGLRVWSRADGCAARFDGTAWRMGEVRARKLVIGGVQVVGAQEPAIADPSGGAAIDAEARSAIGAMLAILRNHGLIAL